MEILHKSKNGMFHSIDARGETLWFERTGARMIQGIASTPTVASNGSSLSSKGCRFRMPIPLISEHLQKDNGRMMRSDFISEMKIGEVVWACKTASAIHVRAIIDENSEAADYAWELIERGAVRCFSVLASDMHLRTVVDGKEFYDDWSIKEVSVCRSGANPDCTFEILGRHDNLKRFDYRTKVVKPGSSRFDIITK